LKMSCSSLSLRLLRQMIKRAEVPATARIPTTVKVPATAPVFLKKLLFLDAPPVKSEAVSRGTSLADEALEVRP